MANNEADIKPDIKAAARRNEAVSLMEPLLIGDTSRHRAGLTDLALELAQRSAGFRRSLPESLFTSLAGLPVSWPSNLSRPSTHQVTDDDRRGHSKVPGFVQEAPVSGGALGFHVVQNDQP